MRNIKFLLNLISILLGGILWGINVPVFLVLSFLFILLVAINYNKSRFIIWGGIVGLIFAMILMVFQGQEIAEKVVDVTLVLFLAGIALQIKKYFTKNEATQNYQVRKYILLIVILLPILVMQGNILSASVLEVGDFVLPLSTENYHPSFSLWDTHRSWLDIGTISDWFFTIIFHAMALINISMVIISKLILIIPLLIASLGSYFLVKSLLKFSKIKVGQNYSEYIAFLISLFYTYNPLSMGRMEQHFHWIGYCFLPLLILLAIKSLEAKKLHWTYLPGVALCFAAGGTSIHLIVYSVTALLAIFASYLLSNLRQGKFKALRKNLLKAFFVIITISLLSAYWIMPVLQGGGSGFQPNYSVQSSSEIDPENMTTLLDVWLLRSVDKENDLGFAFISGILWILAIIGLLSKPFNRFKVFAVIVTILALLVPFLSVYMTDIYQNILGMKYGWLFRDVSRTNALIPIALLTLLTFAFATIFFWGKKLLAGKKYKPTTKILIKTSAIAILFFTIFGYIAPGASSNLEDHYKPSDIPNDFKSINEELDALIQNDPEGKTLWLPTQYDARRFIWAKNQDKVNNFVDWTSLAPTYSPLNIYSNKYLHYLNEQLARKNNLYKYLSFANINSLVLRNDFAIPSTQDWVKDIGENLQDQEKITEKGSTELLKLYNVENESSYWRGYKDYWLVVGGLDALEHLNSDRDFDPKYNPLFFVNQGEGIEKDQNLFENAYGIVLNDTTKDDLIISLRQEDYWLNFKSQDSNNGWFKVSTYDPLHGEWSREFPSTDIKNYDFDFGDSVMTCKNECKLEKTFQVDEEGNYTLIPRVFKNSYGSNLIFKINEEEVPVQTLDYTDSLNGINLGSFYLPEGKNKIEIRAEAGFNAINIVSIKKTSDFEELEKEIDAKLENKQIIFTGKTDKLGIFSPKNIPLLSNKQWSPKIYKTDEDIKGHLAEENLSFEVQGLNSEIDKIDFKILDKENLSKKNTLHSSNKTVLNIKPDERVRLTTEKIDASQEDSLRMIVFDYESTGIESIDIKARFYPEGSEKASRTSSLLDFKVPISNHTFALPMAVPNNAAQYNLEISFQANQERTPNLEISNLKIFPSAKRLLEYSIQPTDFAGFLNESNLIYEESTKAEKNINTDVMKILVASEGYNPKMELETSQAIVSSMPAYSFLNSYNLSGFEGDTSFTKTEYKLDKYFRTGLAISISAAIACMLIILLNIKRKNVPSQDNS